MCKLIRFEHKAFQKAMYFNSVRNVDDGCCEIGSKLSGTISVVCSF